MERVVFFGTSEFAVPILEKLAASQWRPDLVVSTPDAPSGRGLELKPPPIKIAAEKLGIQVIQPDHLSPIPYSLAPRADLFIIAAYGKILPKELLEIPKHGSLNVHPSLLPAWRGPAPIQHTVLSGDQETGVTIILMDEKVDHGPILRNSKFQIPNSKTTTPELTAQLTKIGAELLLETIPDWLAGKIKPLPQDETQATYALRLKKEDGRIDWSKPAEMIERMVRAFQPWPGAYTFWQQGENQLRLVIEEAEIQEVQSSKFKVQSLRSGTVRQENGSLLVQCGDASLAIRRLKPEGRTSMNGEEFLRGHPDILGSHLE